MKITKERLKLIIKEEISEMLGDFEMVGQKPVGRGQEFYVISVQDRELYGTFNYSRLPEKRFLPNPAGEAAGLVAGETIPDGYKMGDAPPMA
jgi:hypothetical protein